MKFPWKFTLTKLCMECNIESFGGHDHRDASASVYRCPFPRLALSQDGNKSIPLNYWLTNFLPILNGTAHTVRGELRMGLQMRSCAATWQRDDRRPLHSTLSTRCLICATPCCAKRRRKRWTHDSTCNLYGDSVETSKGNKCNWRMETISIRVHSVVLLNEDTMMILCTSIALIIHVSLSLLFQALHNSHGDDADLFLMLLYDSLP